MATITIYSTPTCPYCKMAKEFLSEKGISFVEKDVSEDEAAREDMLKKSGQMGVPVIEVNDEIMVGFDQERLASLVTAPS